MRRPAPLILLLAFLLPASGLAADGPGSLLRDGSPAGSWAGVFSSESESLPFELRFFPGGALFSVPSQGVWLRPVAALARSGTRLTVTISDDPAKALDGTLSASGYSGDYLAGGTRAFGFSMKPSSLPPRSGAAVSIPSGRLSLPGTLLVPSGTGPWPVVLILSDSGPTDRDGNSFASAGRSDCLLQLAEALAERGIASLRYDKRGSGESYLLARADDQLLFSDFVADAQAAMEFLWKDKRFSRFSIAGHGEGALVAMAVGARSSARIQGLAFLGASGRPAWAQLEDQLVAALPEGRAAADWEALWRPIVDALKAGRLVPTVPPELTGVFRPSIQPYLISLFALDPVKLLAAYSGDLAIIQGGNDLKAGPEDTSALEKAAGRARMTFIPDMNHVLKDVPNIDLFNLGSYQDPAYPLAAGLASVLADFCANGLATPLPR